MRNLWNGPNSIRLCLPAPWAATAIALGLFSSVLVSLPESASAAPIRPETTCPEGLETLTALLLRDLPSYANRVSQRSLGSIESPNMPGYVLLAGRLEFQPLSLGPGVYRSLEVDPTPGEESPDQVFFTTLNRQYLDDQLIQLQHYHWVFLVKAESGWRLAMMFSRLGGDLTNEPPTPPRDSSQGVIAQAIRLWLRDCREGEITPAADLDVPDLDTNLDQDWQDLSEDAGRSPE